jgi:integrase/recombinase XerD
MFTKFFESSFRIQELRNRPDGRLIEEFAQELHRVGYALITTRRHLRAVEHLVHWTSQQGIRIDALDERFVEEFARHLRRCRCKGFGRTHSLELQNGVRLFIGYLRRAGALHQPDQSGIHRESGPIGLISAAGCGSNVGPAMPPSTTTALISATC